MSISRNILNRTEKTKKFLTSKTFKTVFISFSAFFLFLGVFNVYAQESPALEPDWEGTKEFHNTISGTEADEDNMNSRQGLEVLNAGWTALSIVAPELTANSDEVQANANIPDDLKRGLLGMTEDAGNYAYQNYPSIDIPNHLASNWVPGYDSSTSGVYAAESGYDTLSNSGIMGLWTKILNLSYVFFVLVMIAAGFMIMFRHKLGGQTMVTIGNVLPNVIMALIVATFSFAIAGLVIDLGGLGIIVISDILGGDPVSIDGLWSIYKGALVGSNKVVADWSGGIGATGAGLWGIGGLLSVGGVWGTILGSAGVVGVIGLLVALLILGVIFWGAVKVLIELYKAYFNILLNVILAPIQITLGALPGNSAAIGNWFKTILRNVLVFPVIFFIVNLPNAIAASGDVTLGFPDKLVGGDGGTDFNATGGVALFVLRILVLYFAAQAPKFLEGVLPPNDNKAFGEGIGQARANLSKIPVLGTLFK